MFWIILLVAVFTSTFSSAEIIDLGTYGSTCEIKQTSDYFFKGGDITQDFLLSFPKTDFSYKPRLTLNPTLEEKIIYKPGAFNKKIFIFGALDENSKLLSKNVNADYALCVNFTSVKDIVTFRAENDLKMPIQLANEETLKYLQIDSYPALITIKGSGEDAKDSN